MQQNQKHAPRPTRHTFGTILMVSGAVVVSLTLLSPSAKPWNVTVTQATATKKATPISVLNPPISDRLLGILPITAVPIYGKDGNASIQIIRIRSMSAILRKPKRTGEQSATIPVAIAQPPVGIVGGTHAGIASATLAHKGLTISLQAREMVTHFRVEQLMASASHGYAASCSAQQHQPGLANLSPTGVLTLTGKQGVACLYGALRPVPPGFESAITGHIEVSGRGGSARICIWAGTHLGCLAQKNLIPQPGAQSLMLVTGYVPGLTIYVYAPSGIRLRITGLQQTAIQRIPDLYVIASTCGPHMLAKQYSEPLQMTETLIKRVPCRAGQ